jgi:hypothetical protein
MRNDKQMELYTNQSEIKISVPIHTAQYTNCTNAIQMLLGITTREILTYHIPHTTNITITIIVAKGQ